MYRYACIDDVSSIHRHRYVCVDSLDNVDNVDISYPPVIARSRTG